MSFTTNTGVLIHDKSGIEYEVLDTSNTQANPTLVGTEAALTSLKLNGVDYKVGGGDKLYMHNIQATDGSHDARVLFTIINRDSTAFTASTINDWLVANGMNSVDTGLNCNGIFNDNGLKYPLKVYAHTDGTAHIWMVNLGTTSGWTLGSLTITDTVIEI